MKLSLIMVTLMFLAGLYSVTLVFSDSESVNTSGQVKDSAYVIVNNIETLQKNPGTFIGKDCELSGVVTEVYPENHQFVLSDIVSCSACAAAKGTRITVPVNYSGNLPEKSDMVKVFGLVNRDKNHRVSVYATFLKIR